jgi:hypothetical protein
MPTIEGIDAYGTHECEHAILLWDFDWMDQGHLHQVGESSIRYSLDEPLPYDSSPTNLLPSQSAHGFQVIRIGLKRTCAPDISQR